MKVAYLAPEESFTEKVAKRDFPNADLVPFQSIRNVVMAVENGKVDFGTVPLESFRNGLVNPTLDSLLECEQARIVKESYLNIIYCFGVLSGCREIKRILSKDQALEQCSVYLGENYPSVELINTASTSQAAKMIHDQNMLDAAAIASEEALRKYGLEVLTRDLCPNSKTRFVTLGTKVTEPTKRDKTFLALHPPGRDRPGILKNCLEFFSDINLEFIYSRPDGNKGYIFYLELRGHEKRVKIRNSIEALGRYVGKERVKVFGSYKDSRWKLK